MSVLVHDDDEPPGPVPAWHYCTKFEVARQRQRVLASGGIAGQANAFVIIENLFAVGEMEIVTRHAKPRFGYNSENIDNRRYRSKTKCRRGRVVGGRKHSAQRTRRMTDGRHDCNHPAR